MNIPQFGTPEFERFLGETMGNAEDAQVREVLRVSLDKVCETENPSELYSFLHRASAEEFSLSRGLASSAIFRRLSKSEPMFQEEYGGLGITLYGGIQAKWGIGKNQLWFANLKGDALRGAVTSGNALWYSTNSDNSLRHSQNSGNALRCAVNSENALWYSTNSGDALFNSLNSDFALKESFNRGASLQESSNSGVSLSNSTNKEEAAQASSNSGNAFQKSTLKGTALAFSLNSGFSLRGIRVLENSLVGATYEDSPLLEVTDREVLLNRGKVTTVPNKRIRNFHYGGMSLEDAGKIFKVTRERIRQIERGAFIKLRKKLSEKQTKVYGLTLIEESDEVKEEIRELTSGAGYPIGQNQEKLMAVALQYATTYPHYSSHLRNSESVGYSAQFGNLCDFLKSGPTTRFRWAQREGLFEEE